jgi:hypothetical protein
VAINPTALANINAGLMPAQVTGPIFAKAAETSAVMSLAKRIPLAVNAQTNIPVPFDMAVPDWVGEGGVKPASQVGTGMKSMQGKKLALIVPVSTEVVMTNPPASSTSSDRPPDRHRPRVRLRRHQRQVAAHRAAGPFADYLANCSSTQALGTVAQANGGLYGDIVTGAGKVVDKNFDFTGIAADPRFKVDALLQTDTQGRPLFNDTHSTSTNGGDGTLAGYPVSFNQGVSGKYWRAGDSTQTVTINGTPTGGTFVLSSGGNSATIAYNAASTTTVQTAVQAWGGIYATVTVTGSAGGPYTITFPAITSGVLAESAPFSVDQRLLTGGTAATSKATVALPARVAPTRCSAASVATGRRLPTAWAWRSPSRRARKGSYFDGTTWHSAFQENLTLFLVEAYFGFVMGSNDAFVAYTKGTAAF